MRATRPGPARIIVVGGGAREHALAWRLSREAGVERVLVAPGNDAIAGLPRVSCFPGVRATSGAEVASLAAREAADLAVIGPEAPLAAGVADALRAAGIATFGPSAAAARLETSKSFCRDVAAEAGVRIARGASFTSATEARRYAVELAAEGAGVVVKADGLMAGKGVTVCGDAAEADAAIMALFATPTGADGPVVVVEERLDGHEASVIALCDGTDAVAFPAARDHKRLRDGDAGPNTGGMGAYAPLPDLPDAAVAAIVEAIHRPILAVLARYETPFRGALYAGLMLTSDGPVLLEVNARFGDPEAQVLLPLVDCPLAPLLDAAARGDLAASIGEPGLRRPVLPVKVAAAVGIVVASDGYPEAPIGGDAIRGLDAAADAGALVFHAGTVRDPVGTWRTRGGRAVTLVGVAPDLAGARRLAERAADLVDLRGMRRRHDIAAAVPAGPAPLAPRVAS